MMLLPLLLAVLQAQDPWPFRPLSDVEPPAGVDHPVDAFVDARLKKAGITPAGEADRRARSTRTRLEKRSKRQWPGAMARGASNAATRAGNFAAFLLII